MKRLLLLALLFVCGCSTPQLPPGTLRISFNTYPETMDPRKSGDFASSTLICLLYEGLTRCLPDGTVEPATAYKIDVSEDLRSYTFHLRKTFWSDGQPVTAYDFEKSWKAILDPDFPSLCPYLLYPIKNAEACARREVPPSEVAVRALDAFTLSVELERPTPYFVSLTAFPLLLPFPSHLKENKPSRSLVCNGPFRIERLVPSRELALAKNPKFWNSENIELAGIHISLVADEMTAFHMFERGELDWLGGPFSPIHPDIIEMLKERGGVHFLPSAATTFCTFNTEGPFFKNLSLRKAFSYAINRDEIVEKITQLGQIPATRCLPPSLFHQQNKAQYPSNDLDLARSLFQKGLQELGISPSQLEEITLYFKPGQMEKRIAQTLQKQWKEGLGITIQLQQLDAKSHMQLLQKREYQLALASWIAQFHDPVNILDRFKSRNNIKNYPGWENRQYVDLLEMAAWTTHVEKRLELLEAAEALFAEQMPIAPLYHWSNPVISGPHFSDVPTTPTGGILFEKCQFLKNI
jgi:oligopeptide transport system substrate-binding protein